MWVPGLVAQAPEAPEAMAQVWVPKVQAWARSGSGLVKPVAASRRWVQVPAWCPFRRPRHNPPKPEWQPFRKWQ